MGYQDAKAKYENDSKQDNSDDLYCSANGCTNRWSVQMDGKPKCSFHQWFGSKPIEYGSMHLQPNDHPGDPKGWAKRILDRHDAGLEVHALSLKFAKQALKMTGEV